MKTRIAMAALALPGLMLTPQAHALPAQSCDWVPPATGVIWQDNGLQINAIWNTNHASYSGAQGMDWSGPINGGVVHGTNQLDFTVPWKIAAVTIGNDAPIPNAPTNHYVGTIADNGEVSGITTNDAGVSNTWTSNGFTCMSSGFNPRP